MKERVEETTGAMIVDMTRIGGMIEVMIGTEEMIEAMMIETGEIIEDTTGIKGMRGDTIGIEEMIEVMIVTGEMTVGMTGIEEMIAIEGMIDEMIVDMIGEMTEEVTEETEETTHARKHQNLPR